MLYTLLLVSYTLFFAVSAVVSVSVGACVSLCVIVVSAVVSVSVGACVSHSVGPYVSATGGMAEWLASDDGAFVFFHEFLAVFGDLAGFSNVDPSTGGIPRVGVCSTDSCALSTWLFVALARFDGTGVGTRVTWYNDWVCPSTELVIPIVCCLIFTVFFLICTVGADGEGACEEAGLWLTLGWTVGGLLAVGIGLVLGT